MASGAARLAHPARRRVRVVHPAAAQTRSAEDWWWDRLAPSGSGYHLLQSDSMLLVLPGPGPARLRAQRRAARQARRLRSPGSRAVEAKPSSAPAPLQEPDPGWGDRVPLEILLQIFGLLVAADGPIPFLGRAARVCRRWNEAASQPALWHTLTLSPPLAGRPAKSGAKAEKKLLSSLERLMPNRFSQLQRLTLIHWKSQVHPVLKLVSESCPRLTFLKLSDCHGVTPDALIMIAKACPQLHSLDIQHSMVKSTAVVSFLEEAGPRMRKLWLTYNPQTTAILGALLGSCCPQLQVLEVSTGLNQNITPFQLPIEALQKGCPQLQTSCSFLTAALEALFSQAPKGRISGLPTTSSGKPFQLWAQGLFCTERSLARRLKNNSFYPFTQQQPNVFVLEYYLDTLWKGTLLFIVCILLISFGLVSEVQKQETWGFPAYGVGVGLWLMISSLPRRRLVLNHARGVYHFSIQGRTVCQGPMHLVYVRLALNSDGDAREGPRTTGGRARDGKPRGVGRGGHAGPRPAPGTPLPLPRVPGLSNLPLTSLPKVLLPAGSVRAQAGAASAGAAVGALRANGIPGPVHCQEAQH
ncbi:F-box/LRR-repeat protein 6-like isoform X2 [Cervus elaphus]|uniref:F-box/LRR-repeat protein 6-like isoform X2 n=1 Tax=Cervus elaphus TaxID=9860 RepID=UPI001CC30A97|nr:F-box/LRR-repeat protein 6-like isoform X2 [Cervus elaphus]